MSIQQEVHIYLSIPLYHSTRSFQFINTCEKNDRTFVLLPQQILKNYLQIQHTSIANHEFKNIKYEINH
jgi:hypothetical protein